MKIKISKSQWQQIGYKTGWIKKAGSDWILNQDYTNQIIKELKKRNIKIISTHLNKIIVDYPIGKFILKGLIVQVYQDSYTNNFLLNLYIKDEIIGMPDGINPQEAINNLDKHIKFIMESL